MFITGEQIDEIRETVGHDCKVVVLFKYGEIKIRIVARGHKHQKSYNWGFRITSQVFFDEDEERYIKYHTDIAKRQLDHNLGDPQCGKST